MNPSNDDGHTQNILQGEYLLSQVKGNTEEYTLNPQGLPVWKADNNKRRDISLMRNLTSRLSNTQ